MERYNECIELLSKQKETTPRLILDIMADIAARLGKFTTYEAGRISIEHLQGSTQTNLKAMKILSLIN